MQNFDNFVFQDTTEMSMNETGWSYDSMIPADTYFEQFMSKLSTYPIFTSASPGTGLVLRVSSWSNLLDDQTALLDGKNDGKAGSSL